MCSPPVEGNFCDESGCAVKPRVIEDCNAHTGYVDKLDRMVNGYGIARRTWKWTKKLFFHLTDMTILNAFLLHKTCGGKMKTKGSGSFSFLIRLQNPTSKMWMQVAYLEGGRVHLSPGSETFPALALKRKTTSLLCVYNEEQKREYTVFARSVVLVCASWSVLKDGIHTWMCEWVTWANKVNSKITVYKMYSLPKTIPL